MNTSIYILIGGDGYLGRNFAYFLSERDISFIILDKKPKDESFWDKFPLKNLMKKYYQFDLTLPKGIKSLSEIEVSLKNILLNSKAIIINFAAESNINKWILDPNECDNNNLRCCRNGFHIAYFLNEMGFLKKYIYVSDYKVNSFQARNPYITNRKKCEDYLKFIISHTEINFLKKIKIFRPVNLMDVVAINVRGLINFNNNGNSILMKVIECKPGGTMEIYGNGLSQRMFITMNKMCDLLFQAEDSFISDVSDENFNSVRTVNIKIRDLILSLAKSFKFNYLYIKDPRGIYSVENGILQDKVYSFYESSRDIEKIESSINRMKTCI